MGFDELVTTTDVDDALGAGTTLLLVNSVCGCAAGSARPALKKALEEIAWNHGKKTVFAGVHHEATARAREIIDMEPSSPSIFVLKDGVVQHAIHRRDIQGQDVEVLARHIAQALQAHA